MTEKRRFLMLALISTLLLVSCASEEPAYTLPQRQFSDHAEQNKAEKQFSENDPAQTLNKNIYVFNAQLDDYVLLPVVNAYTDVTPDFLRRGITNFFLNVSEITNFTNALLQIRPVKAGQTLSRFVINTTIGLAGTFDVATLWGVEREPEDFGKTLGYWGAGPGIYIVLPALGPSNLRDTIGKIADYATLYFIIPKSVQDTAVYDVASYGLQPINERYTNDFRYFSTGSPFDYELVRFIATEAREQEIANDSKPAQP